MLRIALNEALPGMKLATAITHPERPSSVLLKADFTLDEATISRLEKIGQREIWIHFPGTDGVERYVNPALNQFRHRLGEIANELFCQFRDRTATQIDTGGFEQAIDGLTEELLRKPDASLFMPDLAMLNHAPPYRHAATVCYLCILLGLKLEGYLKRQRRRISPSHASSISSLAMAGLLHDIGMEEIDPEWLAAWREEGDESDEDWRVHVEHSYRMVSGRISSVAAAAVLHHHQYFDGSGFPRRANWDGEDQGLRGDQIHVIARIVTVADQLDELRCNSLIHPWPVARALNSLVAGPYRRRLDPIVLRALLEIVPAYAPGSAVTLSNGRTAFVLDWRPNEPCRPRVAVIDDLETACEGGSPGEVEIVDLSLEREVFVIEAEGQDVSEDYFEVTGQLMPRRIPQPRDRDLDVA